MRRAMYYPSLRGGLDVDVARPGDICAGRDGAQPHIFEDGFCVTCDNPMPYSQHRVWYFTTRNPGGYQYHAWDNGTLRPLTRERGREVFREA